MRDSSPFSEITVDDIKKCTSLSLERDVCYALLCEYEPGYLCAEDLLDTIVSAVGPDMAMMALHDIMASPLFAIQTDGHLLAHVIGRSLSQYFGSNGENFLRCPHDFNDGCYHGFFEDTLAKVDDPVAVAISICESMPPESTSDKEKSYCYHGAGHVFLMNGSHNLDAAIAHCVTVPGNWHDVCLSGVFMENAWPTRGWEEKSRNFRYDDPLYPCSALESQFRPTCYAEHYSYLMHEHTSSFDGLVELCSGAGENVGDCLSGIGLMLQNPQRTDTVAESLGIADKSYMEKITFLCNSFPEGYEDSCYFPLVGALLNFDYPSMDRVVVLCGGIAEDHRSACFRRAGSYLNHLGSDEVKKQACMTVPEIYQSSCLFGNSSPEIHSSDGIVIGGFEERQIVDVLLADEQIEAHDSFFVRAVHFFSNAFQKVVSVLTRSVFAQFASAQEVATDGMVEDRDLFVGIEKCLSLSGGRVECYASLCEYEPGYLCAQDILREVVEYGGPELGMQILGEMVPSAPFPFSSADEGHGLAHVVGRKTAEYFNGTGEAFLRCPTSFDSGCHHGFFEISLTITPSPAEAVRKICESLPDKPALDKVNCYHGAGHGILMNTSYDFYAALAICKELPDPLTCFSGVTMENVVGFVSGRIQDLYLEHNSFKEDNPHAPCDTLRGDEHRSYRDVCYEQHLPYMAHYFDYDIQGIVDTCLSAGEHASACAHGVGGYGMYKEIQEKLMPDVEGTFVDKTIYLCNHFPEEYRETCYLWAINQSFIFYGAEGASEFCVKIDGKYERNCYREMGRRLSDMVTDEQEKEEKCAAIPQEYMNECLFGRQLDGRVLADIQHEFIDGQEKVDSVVGEAESATDVHLLQKIARFFSDIFGYVLSAFAQSVSAQEADVSSGGDSFDTDLFKGAKRCLALSEGRAECYASLCEYEPGYLCADAIAAAITFGAGPVEAIAALHDMTWEGVFSFEPTSAHQITHTVGRTTGERFGLTGEAFLQCPTDFDYGCHHGFFEAGLAVVSVPAEFIEQTCKSMPDVPPYAKTACYHGSGHALVMNYSYGLYEPLEQCDMLEHEHRRHDCYSGVFMENVGGAQGRKISDEIDNGFRNDDLFAPCNTLDERHKTLCYQSQVSYWMYALRLDLEIMVSMCNEVEEGYVDDCVYNLGAQSIYPPVQDMLLGSDFPGNFIDKTIHICNQFDERYHMRCYEPAIDQNFTYYGVDVAIEFCSKVDEKYRHKCWRIIGRNIGGKVTSQDELMEVCGSVLEEYRNDCFDPHRPDEEYTAVVTDWVMKDVENVVDTGQNPISAFFNKLFLYFSDVFRYFWFIS